MVFAMYSFGFQCCRSPQSPTGWNKDPKTPNVLALEINGSWIEHVAVEDSKLYAAAKKDGVLIYDISNPEEPQQLGKYATGFQAMDINVDDHILYVADGGMTTFYMLRMAVGDFSFWMSIIPACLVS